MTENDPLDFLPYYEPLRVSDVCDALDGIGTLTWGSWIAKCALCGPG